MGELAEGAGWPGVNLEVLRWGWGKGREIVEAIVGGNKISKVEGDYGT